MTIREKLQLILKLSGLKQTELANRLGVTFAALNRWLNERAVPRKSARERIDKIYKEYSGEKEVPNNILEAKKKMVAKKKKVHANVLKEILSNPDIRDQFYLSLTYHSNQIEGSRLSENETAAILFQNAALPNRTLVEQLEAKNHQAALEYLFGYLMNKKSLNEELILKLHGILMNGIMPEAGLYRKQAVQILGAYVPTANYLKVPALMKKLVKNINHKKADTISHLSDIHSQFEKIHPFSDGNGRVGRLFMHAMSLKANLAPAVILQEKRRLYALHLNRAQMKNDQSPLENFICDAILEGYRILERKP